MVDFLKIVIETKGGDMSPDERTLLSVAFKNLITSKRTAWRTVRAIQLNSKYKKFETSLEEYRNRLESNLFNDCSMIIELIQRNVLNKKCDDEAKAFFVKLIADNHRYIAEMSQGDKYEKAKESARSSYEDANAINLSACAPIKLGLVLNLSVFYYEVMKDTKRACTIADTALIAALEKIDDLGEEEFKDAKAIIELLKENLQLWKDEQEEKEKPNDEY